MAVMVLWVAAVVLGARFLASDTHVLWTGCATGGVDFCAFWSAARLALDGQALAAFDAGALSAGTGADWLPWLYPPGTLILLSPLGALPAPAAWVLFDLVSMAVLFAGVIALADGHRTGRVQAALAPALLPALLIGQMIVVWIGLLALALAALRDGHRVVAGVLIGVLTLKPTLGLLIPVALVGLRAWRVIAIAALTALALHGTATLVFGLAYWPAMLDAHAAHGARTLAALPDLGLMASLPALLAQTGVPAPTALALQAALTPGLAALVFAIWRAPARPFAAKAALLVAAIPLATPYLWYYDAALLALAGFLLAHSGQLGAGALSCLAGLALWIGPGALLFATAIHPGTPVAWLLVPLMLIALGAALRARPPSHAIPART